MHKIGDILKEKEKEVNTSEPKKEPSSSGVNSALAEQVEEICQFMDENNERFGYWIGRTKHLKPSQIHDMLKKARREGDNPQALFNWLLKQSK